jgi:WD40 repeat protein
MTSTESSFPESPILRIETGMHGAMINRGALSADGKMLLTASDDKTGRLWALPDFMPLRVLRPPIGEGKVGMLYAAALSPDGQWAALGGWTRPGAKKVVYIFATTDGRLVKTLPDLPNTANHLAFSPDGSRLAVGQGDHGIRVWNTRAWDSMGGDTDYDGDVYGLAFTADHRLASTSLDGHIRLYGSDLGLITQYPTQGGKAPFSVAFSPDGATLAVGFVDSTRVELLSGRDLAHLGFAEDAAARSNLGRVAWLADGANLLAAGRHADTQGTRQIRRWNWRNGRTGTPLDHDSGTIDNIMGILPRPQGDSIIVSAEPALIRLDAAFKIAGRRDSDLLDFRDIALRLSPDGSRVGYGIFRSDTSFGFDAASPRPLAGDDATLAATLTESATMVTKGWKIGRAPILNGKSLPLRPHETSRAIAIHGNTALLGADWSLRRFDDTGRQDWEIATPATAWAVNISGDGRLAVAAFGDGTIRWYKMDKGQELLTLFPHADGKRWVAWTPGGYYAASVGGEDLIGWHINRGPDREADFFPASRFRDTYNRPDVVALVLKTLDEQAALAQADAGRTAPRGGRAPLPTAGVLDLLPPVVEITSPDNGDEMEGAKASIHYVLRSPPGAPAVEITATVNGRQVGLWNLDEDEVDGNIPIRLREAESTIALIARNAHGTSQPAIITLRAKARAAPPANLYILAVGIAEYPDEIGGLDFPAKDAQDFVAAMRAQETRLYGSILVNVINDDIAFRDEIIEGLKWLEKNVTANDVAMVFLAGHGDTDDQDNFHYLSIDTDLDDISGSAVPGSALRDSLATIKGKRIFFIDACHAGAVMGTRKPRAAPNLDRLVNELVSADAGAVVFAASRSGEASLESPVWDNGAFTKALVEGLNGAAAHHGDGGITVALLEDYIYRRVRDLTGNQQSPTSAKPNTVPNYTIALKP